MLPAERSFESPDRHGICTSHLLPPVVFADTFDTSENEKAFVLVKLFHKQLKRLRLDCMLIKLFK